MSQLQDNKGNTNIMAETICEDTHAIADETKQLLVEARSSLTILIGSILLMSLISIFLSTWLAKTITNTPTSFGMMVSRYFGFNQNDTDEYVTWWTPKHVKSNDLKTNHSSNIQDNTTKKMFLQIRYNDYPIFHTIVLPLLIIASIVLAILAYCARIKCTNRDFAWGAVPRIPFGSHVDSKFNKTTIVKSQEAQPGIDYTIVPGTKDQSVVFAIAETLEPLREEGDIIDEGTQYKSDDILKVITHVSSAPQIHCQNVQSSVEQNHLIEMLQREQLQTLSSSIS